MRSLLVIVGSLSLIGNAVAQGQPGLAAVNQPGKPSSVLADDVFAAATCKEGNPIVAENIASTCQQGVIAAPVYMRSPENCVCPAATQTAYQQMAPGPRITRQSTSATSATTAQATFPTYQTQTPASMNQPMYSINALRAKSPINTGYRYRRPLLRLRFRWR